MKKLTKGSIAAAAAGVLLLGGLGTVAFWTDSEIIDGGSVTAGTLSLGGAVCTPSGDEWVYAVGNAAEGSAVELIVPGDTISKTCTFVITATGDNLTADLVIPSTVNVTSDPVAPSLVADVTAVYTTGGVATGTAITSANNGETVSATIEVEFPYGTDEDGVPNVNTNDTQAILAELGDITVKLTQTES